MPGAIDQETGQHHGYGRLRLKRQQGPRPGRANQGEKTSTAVDARAGEWKRRETILKKGKENFQSFGWDFLKMFSLIFC